jgi:hypothetical protein
MKRARERVSDPEGPWDVDLQWLADPVVGDASESEGEASAEPEVPDLFLDPEFVEGAPEGPERPEWAKDLSDAELISKVEELQAKVETSPQEGPQAQMALNAIQQGLAALGDKLQPQTPAPQVAPQRPTETDEEFEERIQEAWVQKPVKAIEETVLRKWGPWFQRQALANIKVGEKLLLNSPKKETFLKYRKEIDEELGRYPIEVINAETYEEIHDRVVSRHYDDLKETWRAEWEAEQARNGGNGTVQRSQAATTGYGERNAAPTGVTRNRRVVEPLSPEEERQWKLSGISRQDFLKYRERLKGRTR